METEQGAVASVTAIRDMLNSQAAIIHWSELQRFFAQGVVIAVSPGLNLLDVAVCFTKDNSEQLSDWMARGDVAPVSDAQAEQWIVDDAELWSVVVAPWVLVQQGGRPATS